MAIYNPGDIPQTSQSVNVGQFGPSHDNLQDWRSVATTANEMIKLLSDLKELAAEVRLMKVQAETAIQDAQSAVALANETNTVTVHNIDLKYQAVSNMKSAVEYDRTGVEIAAIRVGEWFAETSQKANTAAEAAEEALESLAQVESILGNLSKLRVTAHSTDTPSADYNPITHQLQLGIPTRVTGTPGSLKIQHNGVFVDEGEVTLNATDVGAVPADGLTATAEPVIFGYEEGISHQYSVGTTITDSKANFQIIYGTKDRGLVPRRGLILNTSGDAFIGGNLYVLNELVGSQKKVFHQGFPPTAEEVGASPVGACYTKSEADGRFLQRLAEVYTRDETNALLQNKLSLSPDDGKVYGRVGSDWYSLADSVADLTQKFNKAVENETNLTALTGRVDRLATVRHPFTKVVWRSVSKHADYMFISGKTYSVVVIPVGGTVPEYSSVTFLHTGVNKYTLRVNSNMVVTIENNKITQVVSCWVSEIICHDYVAGQ